MQDRRVSVSFIAETLRISRERVEHIIKRVLRMRKVSARWVPRLLTPEQKDVRCAMSRENLRLFQQDPGEFVTRFVTVDETWVHHYKPETKEQSMQWKNSDSPPPKKAKVVPSAQKVMATVFWDAEGVILLDFLSKGKTITGEYEYYSSLLEQFLEEIRQKRPQKLHHGVLFHKDNAPAHKAHVTMATIIRPLRPLCHSRI